MLSWGCKNKSKAVFLLLPPFEESTRGRERIFQYERIRAGPCFPKHSNNSTDVNAHSNEDSHYQYFPWARGDSKSFSVGPGAPAQGKFLANPVQPKQDKGKCGLG